MNDIILLAVGLYGGLTSVYALSPEELWFDPTDMVSPEFPLNASATG